LLKPLALLAVLLVVVPPAAAVRPPPGEALVYRIERNGAKIGRHEVWIDRRDDGTDISVQFKVRVKFAFITAFRMDHQAHERWTPDGALASLVAHTSRSSGDFDVKVAPNGTGYKVWVNGEEHHAPPDMAPSSFTLAHALFDGKEKRITLLDTLSGAQKPSLITPMGMRELDIDGKRMSFPYYEITWLETGEITHRIWMHEDGAFVRLGLTTKDGHYIEYFRQTL